MKATLRIFSKITSSDQPQEGVIPWTEIPWKEMLGEYTEDTIRVITKYIERAYQLEFLAKERAFYDHKILPIFHQHFPDSRGVIAYESSTRDSGTF
jgi:hypothetical protein